jgi:AraC-like DNA-binding protein
VLIDAATFRRVVRARELLGGEAHDELGVREIAARVTLSPSHLIRVFGALFGDTPHQFRTRARLERAKSLLAGGAPVTDVCLEVGFSSLGSFSTLFSRWVGVAPSAWRRSVQVPRTYERAVARAGCVGMLGYLPSGTWSHFREARPR